MQYHQQIQQLPQFQQLLPQQQQQVLGVVQNHIQQHQQMLNQMAQGQTPQAAGGTNAGVAEGNIMSLVRSQAQEVSQAVQNAPGQG